MGQAKDTLGNPIESKRELQPPAPGWIECIVCEMKRPQEEIICPGCGHLEMRDE